jgi:hypothetical protein
MLVFAGLGSSIRARPGTGPLKFIRVPNEGRSAACRPGIAAIVAAPFLAYPQS